MKSLPAVRSVSLIVALCAVWSFSLGTTAAATPASPGMALKASALVAIPHEMIPVVTGRSAYLIARRASVAPMSISLGFPLRHQKQLDAFIAAEEAGKQRPLTQRQFDSRYGEPAGEVSRAATWLRSEGLRVGYRTPDGLMITARGTTKQVEAAFHTTVNQYHANGESFFAPARDPMIPAAIHVQTVLGLDNYYRATFDLNSKGYVRNGGFIPQDFRNAYGVSGHGYYGLGQTLGFTLWGVPVQNSDFAAFSQLTGDPLISSCASCSAPGRIQWFAVNGQSTDTSALGETALDVEYGHGMAPYSHLRYYLAPNSQDSSLAPTIAAAANDTSLHVVSNSWGGAFPGAKSPFVVFTTEEFKHAVAVGTTFYFSSGDTSVYSGCIKTKTGYIIGACQYPASSPYVVAVGGTNIQMNSSLTKKTREISWSLANDLSGSGGGCNPNLARPKWQVGITGPSCAGRAEPDISADGGSDAPANVVVNGKSTPTWGTSLAAPLVAGMAVDTNQYLAHEHTLNASVPNSMGFAAPKLYRLANSAQYHTYLDDVVCGFNATPSPAGPGWDEVTGWGSENWPAYTEGFAGQSVPTTNPSTALCHNVGAATTLGIPFSSCGHLFLCWPQPNGNEEAGLVKDSLVDNGSDNFLRNLHGSSYASHGFVTGLLQTANVEVEGDTTPYGIYLASVMKNKPDAVAVVNDVGRFLKSKGVGGTLCSNSTPDCIIFPQFNYTLPNGNQIKVWYALFSIQNVVGEVALLTNPNTFGSYPDFVDLLGGGIVGDDVTTGTPFTTVVAQRLGAGAAREATGGARRDAPPVTEWFRMTARVRGDGALRRVVPGAVGHGTITP